MRCELIEISDLTYEDIKDWDIGEIKRCLKFIKALKKVGKKYGGCLLKLKDLKDE